MNEIQDWVTQFGVHLHARRIELLRNVLRYEQISLALDIGCQRGLLRAIGLRDAIGVDIRRWQGVEILASAEHLPFRNGTFDLVFAGEVIEHLWKPLYALKDWVRVLEFGGILVISTPNGSLISAQDGHPEHKHTLNIDEIKVALNREGLRVVYARGIFTGLVSGRKLFRWIAPVRMKMSLLRIPVPLRISYDIFVKAIKERK